MNGRLKYTDRKTRDFGQTCLAIAGEKVVFGQFGWLISIFNKCFLSKAIPIE